MSCKDPYACGPQCSCDPCDKPRPLEIVVTAGPPQGEPDPCDNLPVAYDAKNGCFYLWEENTGWFEASGISFEVQDTDPNGTGDRLVLTKCGDNTVFFNSRNTAARLEHRGTSDNDGAEWLVIEQTHGPAVEVNLSDLDSYVTALSLNNGNHVLTLTQNQGKPNQTVNLTYLKQTETDNTITGDGTADDPLSVNWDAICAGSDTVAEVPDNALVIYCSGGQVEKTDFGDAVSKIVAESCFAIADFGEQCSTANNVVAYREDSDPAGCFRLAMVDEATIPRAQGAYAFVNDGKPDNTTGYLLPDDFPDPTNYYNIADFRADGGTDPNDRSGIDEAKVSNSLIARVEFENPCDQAYEFFGSANFAREATAEDAYQKLANISYRYRVNGGAWTYPFTPATGEVRAFGGQEAIRGTYEFGSIGLGLNAGTVEMEVFYLAEQTGNAKFQANKFVPGAGFGAHNPNFTLAKRV